MPEWAIILIASIILGLIGFIWRDLYNRVEALTEKFNASSRAVLEEKVRNLEADYETLHQWKNVILPQQFERQNINILAVMHRIEAELGRRLERIEKHLNGSLR